MPYASTSPPVRTTCKHRWRRWATTGAPKIGRAIILERCARCRAENERYATSAECAKMRENRRLEEERLLEFHRAWRPAQRLLDRYPGADQDSKLKLSAAFERLATKHPNIIRRCGVDDDVFTCSELWFFLHKCEPSATQPGEYWGTSIVYLSQCAGDPPVVFFCYPGHMRGLLAVAKELEAMARGLNRKRGQR